MPSARYCLRNFGVILYPDRLEHRNMLEYLEKHDYLFQIVYILHDRDLYDEEDIEKIKKRKEEGTYTKDVPNVGDIKEPHYHVLIHCKNPYSLKGFLNFFHAWIDHAEVLNSVASSIMYMLHDTPNSLNKVPYHPKELKGDIGLIRSVVNNSNFVQLGELLDLVELNCGSSLHLLRACCKDQRTDLLACIRQYQSLITLAMNQEFRMHYDESFLKR